MYLWVIVFNITDINMVFPCIKKYKKIIWYLTCFSYLIACQAQAIRLIHLYFITRSSTHACMYQHMYTWKHVPLHVLPRVLARVSLGVPLRAQAHVHLSVFLPYENFTWLYTHRSTYTYSGTRKHTCNSTRGCTHTITRSGTCMRVYTRWYTQARVSLCVKYCRWINILCLFLVLILFRKECWYLHFLFSISNLFFGLLYT